MTTATTPAYSPATQRLAVLAKALAHPARIAILHTLAQRGTCVCGQIVEVLPLAQATVSQHLKELKEAGLVQGEVEGPRVCYCLNEDGMRELEQLMSSLIVQLQLPALQRCC